MTAPMVQYLPLRRALTNNVRIRCTWRCQAHLAMPGTPGDFQVHLSSAYLKQGAPAIPRVHLWTAGLQVHLDNARCARENCRSTYMEMPGAPLECQVHLASAYLKQGAPAIPKAHLWTAGGFR
jgi:hypothetical protein